MTYVVLTVKLDSHVYEVLSDDEKQRWVDDLVLAANNRGQVTDVDIRSE